ncbi:MAG: GyrI-like domain-containing protein [Paracoccaceae bacterium]
MIDLPEPDVVDTPGQRFVGLAADYDMGRRREIPALYTRFLAARDAIAGAVTGALYGISFAMQPDGRFRYAVAVEVPEPGAVPEGFTVLETDPGPWAVFRQRAPVEELPARFDAVFARWLPGSGLAVRPGPVFERYPDDDAPEVGRMLYEIWVPVRR